MKTIIALIFALALTGCATLAPGGAYNGDKALYIADTTEGLAYETVHAFVSFESDNRVALASHPEIKAAADDVRAHTRGDSTDWFKQYERARDIYAAVNTPANQAAFKAAFAQLSAGVEKASAFLLSAQTLVKK